MTNDYMIKKALSFNPSIGCCLVLLATLLTGCSDSSNYGEAKSPQATPDASLPAAKPMTPMFVAAKECLDTCSQIAFDREAVFLPTSLPRKFKDFLDNDQVASNLFISLVTQLPESFWPFAVKGAAERENMEMEGWTGYIMKSGDDLIQIYHQVGYPKREWTSGPNRRPPGSLTVGFSTATKKMAIIFKGQEDLSEYRFVGDERLLSIITAYEAASEAETERAYLISRSNFSGPVIFPVPSNQKDDAVRRLSYLNGLFNNGQIVNARSAYSAGDDARRTPPEKQWWVVNGGFSECFETGGPAEKLDELVGVSDKPTTNDYRDGSGKLYKVEVIHSLGFGREEVWTYYRTKAACEAEQVNATKNLADRYR